MGYDSLYNPGDMTKVGIVMTGFGVFFFLLGIFMFLDSSILTIGNLLFSAGMPLTMGPQRCKSFFLDRRRARSSICFFIGIVMVMFRWCFIGLIIQGFGALNLFGNFFPMMVRMLEALPLIGPVMRLAPVQKAVQFFEGRESRRTV
eukprot:Tbor_TRINITY_DN5438_c0_g2::TRINITY_DN5438_c0_g2_i1::g.24252::m.24252